jgi:WASH complex subunit 7
MRNLCKKQYGIILSNVYLPTQTLEQGLDLLVITKNINFFVSKYSYNLNNNFFLGKFLLLKILLLF